MRSSARAVMHAYSRLLHERPLVMNVLTGSVLGGLGELIAQRLERRDESKADPKWDYRRCATAGCVGAGMNGVIIPYWYRWLDTALPGTGTYAVACKSVADIVVNGGLGNAFGIAARGAPASEVWKAMPGVMLMDCTVWLPYNLVAFGKIPPHVRPTTTAFVTLGWNTYLSYVAAQGRGASECQCSECKP